MSHDSRLTTDDCRATSLAAECVLIHVDGRQEVVTLETHADAHRLVEGEAKVGFQLSSDASVLIRRDQSCGGRNITAEAIYVHYLGRNPGFPPAMKILGPALFVGINRRTGSIETLPGEWKKPLTEWGERR